MSRVEWHWVERFGQQFGWCGLTAGESVVVLSESASRPELVETASLAVQAAGAALARIERPTPPNRGPVPIRSTGASVAIQGHAPTVAALQAADFVIDCTVEGLLHAPELGQVLESGTRILMISNEHPETFERMTHDPESRRAGRARQAMDDRSGDDARDVAAWHRSHGGARRGVPSRIARLHRPSPATSPTGRADSCSRSPRPARSTGTDRDGARRREPHVQGVRPFGGPAHDRRRPHHRRSSGDGARRPTVRELSRSSFDERGGLRHEPCRLGDESQPRAGTCCRCRTSRTRTAPNCGRSPATSSTRAAPTRWPADSARGHFDLPMRHCTIALDDRHGGGRRRPRPRTQSP